MQRYLRLICVLRLSTLLVQKVVLAACFSRRVRVGKEKRRTIGLKPKYEGPFIYIYNYVLDRVLGSVWQVRYVRISSK